MVVKTTTSSATSRAATTTTKRSCNFRRLSLWLSFAVILLLVSVTLLRGPGGGGGPSALIAGDVTLSKTTAADRLPGDTGEHSSSAPATNVTTTATSTAVNDEKADSSVTPDEQPIWRPSSCSLIEPGAMSGAAADNDSANTEGTGCAFFYPARFFAQQGPSFARFRSHYDNRMLWPFKRHNTAHFWLQSDAVNSSRYYNTLTFVHIPKCGGTTTFVELAPRKVKLPYNVNFFRSRQDAIIKSIYDNQVHQRQQRQQQQRQAVVDEVQSDGMIRHQDGNTSLMFTFVRDPVERFVSALDQMLTQPSARMRGTQLMRFCNPTLGVPATPIDANQTLRELECIISVMMGEHDARQPGIPRYEDEHLLPQAYNLQAYAMGLDIEYLILDLSHITSTLDSLVWRRRGPAIKNPSQRSTSPSVLTPHMLERVCFLYEMDVLLLRQAHILSSTLCDEYVNASSVIST